MAGEALVGTWLLAWSLLGLGLMGLDKARATLAARRVPERALVLVAIAGGAAGVLAGAYLVRHKTRKPRVLAPAWAALAAHAALLAWALRA